MDVKMENLIEINLLVVMAGGMAFCLLCGGKIWMDGLVMYPLFTVGTTILLVFGSTIFSIMLYYWNYHNEDTKLAVGTPLKRRNA